MKIPLIYFRHLVREFLAQIPTQTISADINKSLPKNKYKTIQSINLFYFLPFFLGYFYQQFHSLTKLMIAAKTLAN